MVRSLGGVDLEILAPPTAALAPAGFYMLFVVTSGLIPSHARFVQLDY